jgi:Ca2+-transporting ATPase
VSIVRFRLSKTLASEQESTHQSERVPQSEGHATWHVRSAEDALRDLGSTRSGLSASAATEKLRTLGPNELEETSGNGLGRIFWEQASSSMILILLVAGVLALIFKGGSGFPVDAVAIFAIVVLFVVLGTLQEYRAQKAIAALKQMSMPSVRVMRDETPTTVPSRELVPGDVMLLEAGHTVPADGRLLEVQSLRVQESALTGESEPVEKKVEALSDPSLGVGDRINMVFLGSAVTFGRAKVLVVETGQRTELGRIATLIQAVKKSKTPLQKKLDKLGKALGLLALAIAMAVAFIGVFIEGQSWSSVLVLAISIAVAVVPEGLPAVLTFTLALGAQRMLKRKALVRKLPAVETLGSVTTICSDKTGTLTQNHMTVTRVMDASGQVLDASFLAPERTLAPGPSVVLQAFTLCTDVERDSGKLIGDPTEIALVEAAEKAGFLKLNLVGSAPRVAEHPFDSDRKLMTTVHDLDSARSAGTTMPVSQHTAWLETVSDHRHVAITKGAMEQVLSRCRTAFLEGRVVSLDQGMKAAMVRQAELWADGGERVLAVAARGLSQPALEQAGASWEDDLSFIGLCAMIDPPRPEARAAVATCRKAGVRVVMITGDHPATAKAIALDLGVCDRHDEAVTGADLSTLDEGALRGIVESTKVYARVSPEQKLRIVAALQANGHIVAMTGDGVNDAPALRKADIGVAMGTGTDVAKEAADIVLLDDNFATIVAAIEEGRVVYDNLRRFLMFSLSGNVAKVILVVVSPLVGLKAMLTPIQILFSNLLTDGLLGLGMGLEKAEKDTMSRPPFKPDESVFARGVGLHIVLVGPMLGAALMILGFFLWPKDQTPESLTLWGTTLFTALAFTQVARAFSARSFSRSVLSTGVTGNKALLAMVAVAIVLQVVSVTFAPVLPFFETTALSWERLGLCAGMALVLLALMEAVKAVFAPKRTPSKEVFS